MTCRSLFLVLPAAMLVVATGCFSENDLGGGGWPPDDPLDTDDNIVADGPQPDIKVEPMNLGFGYHLPDCPTDPQTVTVSNVGDADLEIYDIIPTGPGISSFTYNGPSGAQSLAVGDSFTFTVVFEADNFADYEGIIEITSNDPDEATTGPDVTGHGSETPRAEDLFEQPIPEGVDVLWVLDNSCSMGGIIDSLTTDLDTFVNTFTTLGLDYQLGVTTTDMDSPGHQGRLQGSGVMSPAINGSDAAVIAEFNVAVDAAFNTGGSGTEKGRDGAYAALRAPLINNENLGMIRSDAHLAIIVVSDEEDQSGVDRTVFINWLDGLKGDPDLTSFSAMAGEEMTSPGGIGFPSGCGFGIGGGATAEPSYEYPHVTNQTGGLYTELCNQDFDEVLVWLSYYAAGLSTEFCLTDVPVGFPVGFTVEVNGVPVNFSPINGYTLDTATNCIEFHGDSIPGPAALITVTYGVNGTCG